MFCTAVKDQTTGHDWVVVSGGFDKDGTVETMVRYYDATLDDNQWNSLTNLPQRISGPPGSQNVIKFSEFEVIAYVYKNHDGVAYPINEGMFFSTLTRTWTKSTTPFTRDMLRVKTN